MAQLLTLRLSRHDAQPWGFRLQGGKDFGTPLIVQKVNGGSIAEQAGLIPGDAVIKINNIEVFNLRHKDAQDIIVRSGNTFDVTIQRGGSTWRPAVTPVGGLPAPSSLGNSIPTVTKTSLAHRPQEVRHIGSGYNNSARPFSSVNGSDGQVKSIVNKQYNSPVGIYSEEAIAETLSAQAEVLAGGVLGVNFKKNEKVYNAANSEVYKFLHEQESEPSEPAEKPYTQSVQHNPQSANHQVSASVTRHVSAPIDRPKAPSTGGLPAGQNICAECERLIVGVFVRVKDRNLHVDCFKCATCGTSLKNQGYYNFNNKLYCDIHAKLAAMNNPPPGTEGYVPVPIKPNTKLSANTISAAINAHHHQSNGTSHLITSPTSNSDPGPEVALPFQPSHSRTSSSSSSVGTTNSCISSLSPNMSSTPEKLSPVHSRQSSGSGTLVGGAAGPNLQQLKTASVPPTTVCTMSGNETTINHKQNENDMNSNNRNTSNATAGGGGHGAPQANVYNQFLKEYASKKTNETTDGGNKSLMGDTNGNSIIMNMTSRGGVSNGIAEGSNTESLYGTIRPDTKIQPHEEFQYITLDGSIIKSVIPPGKGIKTNYKVHQGYGGPKPFGSAPKTPPISGPRSPSTYPPPSHAPSWGQPKPATNPYATLPRTGSSQGRFHTYKPGPTSFNRDPTNIPVPPPPPPVTAPITNGYKDQNGKVKEHPDHPGRATEMLASSLERLNINTQENFRVEAEKILSNMLEARLAGKSPPRHILKDTTPHPMKNVIDLCDSSPPVIQPQNNTADPVKNEEDPQIKSPVNGKLPELEPLETVIYRNKTTNPSAKRELTSHALDRRSYIEKDQQDPQEGEIPKSVQDDVEPEKIANELKDGKHPICCHCNIAITRGPFITALGRIWCPEHFICVNANCRRPLQDIGFVEEKGDLYCEYCFEKYLAPTCSKCNSKIKGDCLNAIGKHFHPECFTCSYCGKLFGNSPFFLEEGEPYCEADWNELFTTKCFACGFPVEAGDRWVEALNHNYHSQCFNCTMCKKNLEGQSFYNKGGRPFCKNHAR